MYKNEPIQKQKQNKKYKIKTFNNLSQKKSKRQTDCQNRLYIRKENKKNYQAECDNYKKKYLQTNEQIDKANDDIIKKI